MPLTVDWSIVLPTRVAALDSGFEQRLVEYPELARSLIGRAIQRSKNLAVNMAIVHQARVDVRLHMLLWHLAARWGRVRSDGTVLRLRLTHTVLADLVAARRPTVTTALSELTRRGLVRTDGETWVLTGRGAVRPPGLRARSRPPAGLGRPRARTSADPLHIDPYIVLGSAIIGLLVGMTGAGGGALMTPMLILLFGVTPAAAISSDLVAAVVMRPFGAGVHLRAGTVNLRLVRWMVIGSVPAAFLGAYLLHVLGNSKSAQTHIETVLGIALLIGASAMVLRFVLDRRSGQHRLGVVHDIDRAPAPDDRDRRSSAA